MQRPVGFKARLLFAVITTLSAGLTLLPAASVAQNQDASAAQLNPREVSEYRQDFGVSKAQAEERLETQRRGADIVAELKTSLGDRYAGVWFDNEKGEFVVPTLPSANRSAVAAEFSENRIAGEYRTSPATSTWSELEAAQDRIDADLSELFDANLIQTSLDPRTNAVVLSLASAAGKSDRAALARATKASPVRVELRDAGVERFEGSLQACGNEIVPNCSRPLRGGVEIGEKGSFEGDCSAGFRAIGDANGQTYLLTAGHCARLYDPIIQWDAWDEHTKPQPPYLGNPHYLGELEQYSFPGGDWLKINITGTWWDTDPLPAIVAYWNHPYQDPPIDEEYPITGEAQSYVGQGVCHSGMASGGSCGQVVDVDVTENLSGKGQVHDLVKVKGACGQPGDSGSPWFASNVAYGLHHGTSNSFTPCEAFNFYAEITDATDDLGVHLDAPAPTTITKAATSVGPYQAKLNGSVHPHSIETTYHFDWGQTSGYGNSTAEESAGHGSAALGVDETVTGLDPATTYHYRVKAKSAGGVTQGSDVSFTTPAAPPKVTTEGTQSIRVESETGKATLKGKVNPGGAQTDYRFEWGTQASGSFPNWAPVPDGDAGDGISFKSVQAAIEGLKGSTTYHYRLRAENSKGTDVGSVKTFTTPDWRPEVTTGEHGHPFVEEETGKVDLKGTVNPKGFATDYRFEWGTQAEFEEGEYSNSVPVPDGEAGNSTGGVEVEQTIEGLEGSTTYHYRLVAENAEGESIGADKSFTTPDWRPLLSLTRALEVGRTEATLSSKIHSRGFSTDYRFEWGETESYGNVIPIPDGEVGSSKDYIKVGQALEGLEQRQTYHFRVVAESTQGVRASGDRTLTTSTSGFVVDHYPAIVEVEPEGFHTLRFSGAEVSCSEPAGTAEAEGRAHETLTPTLPDANCQEPEGEAPLERNGCTYTLNPGPETSPGVFGGSIDIGPPGCGPMKLDGPICDRLIPAQTDLAATFRNEGEGKGAKVSIEAEDSFFEFVNDGGPPTCGATGSYTGDWELVARDEAGESVGVSVTNNFALPEPTTEAATDVTPTEATLNGSLDTLGLPQTFHGFEYGTTAEYGSETAGVLAGSQEVSASERITGLEPNTTYHFRYSAFSFASHLGELALGADRTFTTSYFSPLIEAEDYPAALSASQDPEAQHVLVLTGRALSCEDVDLEAGDLTEATTEPPAIEAQYVGCEASGLPTKLSTHSCRFALDVQNAGPPYLGEVDIVCAEEGDAIEARIYTNQSKLEEDKPICVGRIGPQQGLAGVDLQNVGQGSGRAVQLDLDLEGIEAAVEGPDLACGSDEQTSTYTGGVGLEAHDEGEQQTGLYVGGEGARPYLVGEQSEEEADQPRLEADSYPLPLTATEDSEDPHTLLIAGRELGCEDVDLNVDDLTEATAELPAIGAQYAGCEASGFSTKLNAHSCHFELRALNAGPPYLGEVDIVCAEEGDAIEVRIYSSQSKLEEDKPICVGRIDPQQGLAGVDLQNVGEGQERAVELDFDLGGIEAAVEGPNLICGPDEQITTYAGGVTLEGL